MAGPPESTRAGSSRTLPALAALGVIAVCAATLLMTSPGLPMAWDEGNAVWRCRGIQRWAQLLVTGNRNAASPHPLSREGIAEHWRYTTQIEGHPALYGIAIAAGRWVSRRWLGPLDSYRFGPMLLFSLAAGAMFYRMARDYSLAAGLGAVAALMLLPRVFAHAHFASFDGPLTACWVLAWATFAPAREGRRGAILFGIALGMTLSAKATGWIAPLPFLAWTLLYRDRAAAKGMAAAIPVALVTFFLLNPPLWHDPIDATVRFLQMNLGRGRFNIPTQFLGETYHLDRPLPWYNTLLWTGITVPVGILVLMGVGIAVVLRRWRDDRAGVLLLAGAAALLIVRALPGVPPHDGVRLFLPSFAFLAALAGVGAASVLECRVVRGKWRVVRGEQRVVRGEYRDAKPGSNAATPHSPLTPRPSPLTTRRLSWVAVLLVYAGSATSLIWYAPQWLSYYNLAIGGLPGAAALGMEPTYYWTGLDRSVLEWLHKHTAPDEKVLFGPVLEVMALSGPKVGEEAVVGPVREEKVQAGPVENLRQMQTWGLFRRRFAFAAPGRYRWYVIQHRPSAWQAADAWLVARAEPALRRTIRGGGWGPWRLDVPLVEVYSYDQYLGACRRTEAGSPGP
jgi:uncharacterized membrane protein YhaH (DUF805 family)